MSQQIIDISTPDDGLGDVLRTGFDKTNQNFTELYNGKVDKVTGKGLSKNDFTDPDKTKLDGIEEGAQVNVQADAAETDPLSPSYILNFPPSLYASVGHFHYNDLATHTTPLVVLPSVPKKLTNDTLGVGTEKDFAPYGVADVWEITDNAFTFSPLDLGDQAQVRFDFLLSSTSPSQKFTLYVKFGVGSPSEYDMLVSSWVEKDVITYGQIIRELSFSIDNEDWLYNQAEIYILSDDDASVKVNGWYVPIIRKSINVIDFNSDPLKLDKSTTPSSVYTTNAGGLQVMKPTSEFKDVLDFADFDAFPTTGETGKIYVALDTNKIYRWSGYAYVQIGGGSERKYFETLGNRYTLGTINAFYSSTVENGLVSDNINAGVSTALTLSMATKWVTPLLITDKICKLKNFKFRATDTLGGFTQLRIIFFIGQSINGQLYRINNQVIHDEIITMSSIGQINFFERNTFTNDVTIPKGYDLCYLISRLDGTGTNLYNVKISGYVD